MSEAPLLYRLEGVTRHYGGRPVLSATVYLALADALRRRGYEGERLEAILSANLLRLFRRALPA